AGRRIEAGGWLARLPDAVQDRLQVIRIHLVDGDELVPAGVAQIGRLDPEAPASRHPGDAEQLGDVDVLVPVAKCGVLAFCRGGYGDQCVFRQSEGPWSRLESANDVPPWARVCRNDKILSISAGPAMAARAASASPPAPAASCCG